MNLPFELALRSLASRPVRSAVLAGGFGFGIAVMATLLGVGEVVLRQARSPVLLGGGDLLVSGPTGQVPSGPFVVWSLQHAPSLAGRVAALSPTATATLHLSHDDAVIRVRGRGGIPSLERSLGDPETAGIVAWTDRPADRAWTHPAPGDLLRSIDRFHPVPDVSARRDSWAEWLYFNGTAQGSRFYLTFLVRPAGRPGLLAAGVRLQLERDGSVVAFSDSAEIEEADVLSRGPDLAVGASRVELDGLRYRIRLDLAEEPSGNRARPPRRVVGEITLDAAPGQSIPPLVVHGAAGWRSGYAVPVLSGALSGRLQIGADEVRLDSGTGYHDHNWGFWKGVSWRWGQVAGPDLSIVYGRIHPPADVADPERIPGLLAVLGPEGPLAFSTAVTIDEIDDPLGVPRRVTVHGRGPALDLELVLDVEHAVRTRLGGGPAADGSGLDLLQLRARARVSGRAGPRTVDFSAQASAETFRGTAAAR